MLYPKNVEISKMVMENMTTFLGRKVEVYRSTDMVATGQYFTTDKEPAYFELVIFDYHQSMNMFYLRYPNTEYYIELTGLFSNSRGNMKKGGGRNKIEEIVQPRIFSGKQRMAYIGIMKHEDQAIIQFGYNDGDFNFLTRVSPILIGKYECESIFKEVFQRKYIPIPNYRSVEYSFKTEDNNYIIVDASVSNYSYDDLNFHYGNLESGMVRGTIINFTRYRDGGTTIFNVFIDGKDNHFYTPATIFNDDRKPTWNGKKIEKVDATTLKLITKSLNLFLENEFEPLT